MYREYRHDHQEQKKAELLVGLLEGVDQRLEAGKVPHQLEDPHDAHDPHQPDYLSCGTQ